MTRHIANAVTPVGLLDGVLRGPDWTGALCRQVGDPGLWFPDSVGGTYDWDTPRSICLRCPLIDACREYAMTRERHAGILGRHGMWGGLTPRERYRLQLARRAQ